MKHRIRFVLTTSALATGDYFRRQRGRGGPGPALLAAALLSFANLAVAQSAGTALVRRAPILNGGTIDGSLQMMSGESVTLSGPITIMGDMRVPGTPAVRVHGKPTFSGTIDGTGHSAPSEYQITLNGAASLRNVVRRTDPVTIANNVAVRPASGTRSVTIMSSSEVAPDFSTVRDFTLNTDVGQFAVPPGAYGAFTARAGSGFILGVAGSTQPAQYDFERLHLAAGSQLQVVGPVVINVANAVTANGVLGSSAEPSWLTLNIASGGISLAGSASLTGYVNAPAGIVALSGIARLTGGVIADSLSLVGDPVVRLRIPPVPVPQNMPPTVALSAPADGTLFTAPAAMRLAATAGDLDGTVTRVEFYAGASKLGEALAAPYEFDWINVPPGAYTLTAKAHDNAGASASSAPRTVTVQIGVPYFTGFEASDGYLAGAISGQLGWTASGLATLIESASYSGSRALAVGGSGVPAQAAHSFPSSAAQTVVFVDFFAQPAVGSSPASSIVVQADAAHVAFVRSGDHGEILVLQGNGTGAGTWIPSGITVPLGSDGRTLGWVRLTLREDFAAKRWDLYVNRRLVACENGFMDDAAQGFARIAFGGPAIAASRFDDFFAGFDNPLFVDSDRDGMDDSWESQHGLDPLANDRNGDLDADGVSNIREYKHGTQPDRADTDGDSLPDGWEIRYGLSPTQAASATDDSDADGLTDLQEFAAGTNPTAADTDGDGMPDGWETSFGFDPNQAGDAAADADGDGKSNLLEYQTGTHPHEYYNGILPHLVSLVGPNLRTGPNGLVSVRVTRADGTLLTNAPIDFETASGGILISTGPAGSTPATTASVRSDAQALASVYVHYPSPAAALSTLVATARSGAQTQTLSISLAPPILDIDGDSLDDNWERKYLGGLDYSANDDPGSIGRTLSQSHFLDVSPWPAAAVASGLQVWYRADLGVAKDATGKVSRWADLSGNAVHVAQANSAAQPVALFSSIGGQASIRFDGVASTMRTSSAVDLLKGSTDITVIVVVQAGTTQATYADIMDYNHGTAPYGGFALQQNVNALNQYGFGWRDPSNQVWIGLASTAQIAASTPQLLEFVKGGATQSGYLNGATVCKTPVPVQMLVNAPRIFSLASFVADNSRYFNGEIAEVLIYNRALTSDERTTIEDASGLRYFDTDGDGLSDLWETTKLGTLSYGAQDDPGGANRTLLQSFQQRLLPWPAAPVGAGLQLWYRADLGVAMDSSNRVTRWTDLSGNGGHAMQGNPTAQPTSVAAAAGNLAAIRFNGSTTVLRSGFADLLKDSTDMTIIAVVKPAATQVTHADILDYDHATVPYGGFVVQQNGNALNQYAMGWMTSNNSTWAGLASTVTVPAGTVQFLSFVKAGSAQSGFLNGEQKFAANIPSQMVVNAPRAVTVGNFAAGGGRAFNGDIAEILIYNRALSAAERSEAETALAQKYSGTD